MKTNFLDAVFSLAAAACCFVSVHVFAASPGPLEKAKQGAEAKGYVFLTNRDEIVAKAKKEGKLRILAELEPPNIKASSGVHEEISLH